MEGINHEVISKIESYRELKDITKDLHLQSYQEWKKHFDPIRIKTIKKLYKRKSRYLLSLASGYLIDITNKDFLDVEPFSDEDFYEYHRSLTDEILKEEEGLSDDDINKMMGVYDNYIEICFQIYKFMESKGYDDILQLTDGDIKVINKTFKKMEI